MTAKHSMDFFGRVVLQVAPLGRERPPPSQALTRVAALSLVVQ